MFWQAILPKRLLWVVSDKSLKPSTWFAPKFVSFLSKFPRRFGSSIAANRTSNWIPFKTNLIIGTRACYIKSTSEKSSCVSRSFTKPSWNSYRVMYFSRKRQIASMSVWGKWTSSEYEPNSVTLTWHLDFSSSSFCPFYFESSSAQRKAISSSVRNALSLSLCFFSSS